MDRRDFVKKGAVIAGAAVALGAAGCTRQGDGVAGMPTPPAQDAETTAALPPPDPAKGVVPDDGASPGKVGENRVFTSAPGDVHAVVATGTDPVALVTDAIAAYAGLDAIVRKGDAVVIKPCLAWGRTPETGANTSPEVLAAVIGVVRAAEPSELLVVEHSCDRSVVAFEMSGARAVCEQLDVPLISLDSESMYEEVLVSQGINIKSEHIARDILQADVYINLPCLKHHAATNLSLAMKNQMGAIFDPQRYHRERSEMTGGPNLHQNIADLASALRPTVVIADATRALSTNGPKGPGNILQTNSVVVSHDMVAVDVVGAEMLGMAVEDVAYLGIAADMGLGVNDVDSVTIARV